MKKTVFVIAMLVIAHLAWTKLQEKVLVVVNFDRFGTEVNFAGELPDLQPHGSLAIFEVDSVDTIEMTPDDLLNGTAELWFQIGDQQGSVYSGTVTIYQATRWQLSMNNPVFTAEQEIVTYELK